MGDDRTTPEGRSPRVTLIWGQGHVGISKKTVPQANDMCECGHAFEAHEHYRKGTECSICDVRACSAFSAVTVAEYSNAQ